MSWNWMQNIVSESFIWKFQENIQTSQGVAYWCQGQLWCCESGHRDVGQDPDGDHDEGEVDNITRLQCPEAIRDTVKNQKEENGNVGETLGSNDNDSRQGVSQESKLKSLHELYDDFVDSRTKAKPNGKQSKIRKYFTNLTVRDKSEVDALIFESCGG